MSAPCTTPGILVVEDDPLVSSYVTEILRKFALPVCGCASCGPEAIVLAEQNEPKLAIADIQLRGPTDGIEVARILRERFGVRTIFLSGVEDDRILERARDADPLGMLKKPFLPSQLLDAIPRAFFSGSATPDEGAGEGADAAS